MLRILHTADWHLGQTFHGFDRDYEHSLFLDWLLRTLVERRIDALLIAGDIFDSVNPSSVARQRFFDFLKRAHLASPKLQIVITAGNHDAGAQLEAPAGLLGILNINVVGTVPRDDAGLLDYRRFVVPLRDAEGKVAALALAVPFLRPADVPEVPEAADAYLDGIRELYRRTVEAAQTLREREFPQAALVALGHCHVQGGEESRESERRIVVIGGAEALRVDTFPAELIYVALGHLHRPQQFEGGRLHYCGSPIPLSFSERDYEHRVIEVVIDDSGSITCDSVLIPKTAMLQRVPPGKAAPIADVLQHLAEITFDDTLPPGAHPFLEVRVLDDGPDPTRRRRIEEALVGKAVRFASLRLEAVPRMADVTAGGVAVASLADLGALDPEEILMAAHQERHGTEPEAAVLAAFREILAAEAHIPAAGAP